MENMTPQQALQNLYNATRQLAVNAETHEALHKMAVIVEKALESKPKIVNTTNKEEKQNGTTNSA